MSDFSQWISLIHELRQSICSKEWIDNRRNSLRINQINRSKHFIVTHIHTLTDGTRHTCQTNRKLIGQLFSYSTYTTVTQVVNIINIRFRVNQLNQILNDFNNILFCQYLHIHVRSQSQLFVDSVTSYLAKVISFFREEQVIDNLTSTGIISRICITQLTVNVKYSLFFRVARVFLKGIKYNRVVGWIRFFLVNKDILNAWVYNFIDMILFNHSFTVDNNLITFNRNNFTCVFIYEIFCPCF